MRKVGRAALAVSFCFSVKVALAHAVSQPAEPIRDPQVSDIFVPEELGYVLETHESTSAEAPLVIHIQEAHTNYEAQSHIVGILERLIQEHGLKLILVEGGSGDVSLSYLRGYGPLDNRRQVADKYLKLGILSAEEYLDIVSDQPLILWGVEDRALYRQNVDAFLSSETLRESLRPVAASVREAVDVLKPLILDPALASLEQDAAAFENSSLSLAEYAERLAALRERHGLAERDYPQLARFLAVRELEQAIQPEEIGREQQALLERLSALIDEAAFQPLVDQATQVKAGTLTREEFYRSLQQLADSSQVPLDGYPALAGYLRYLQEKAELKATELSSELDRLADALKAALASTPESRELIRIADWLDLVEKLAEFKLSPEEYRRFRALSQDSLLAGWGRTLNEQLAARGLPARTFPGAEACDAHLAGLQRFYEAAEQRDAALAANAGAKLRETGEPLAVLITGGFHSPAITQALKDRGLRLVVVAPKVNGETNERLYEAVLRYKAGRGSFKEVQAAQLQ